MEGKRLSSKLAVVCFVALCACLSAGCEGYLGSGWDLGTDLLDPDNLWLLTENPESDKFIIDVRSSTEYNAGHIPTALSFPSTEIATRLGEAPLNDPNNYLIVYCQTGGLAQLVIMNDLIPNGNTRVMNWGGGATKWTNAGYSLE